jgi:hypothetical protein
MRSLLGGLLSLHGHVIDSRRSLRWADSPVWRAQRDIEHPCDAQHLPELLTCAQGDDALDSVEF